MEKPMRRKWIIVYIVLFFLPFIALLILGKMGFFEQKPAPEQPQGYTVALYRHKTQTVEQIPLRDYLWGVLAGEMPASYPEEALKAQAVASYSYLLHRKNSIAEHPDSDFGHPGDVCDNPAHCKAYRSPTEAAEAWGTDWLEVSEPRLSQAVRAVLGKAVLYEGKPANTVFHAISGGKTESAADTWGAEIPYLIPVDSHWDQEASGFESTAAFSIAQFKEKLDLKEIDLGTIQKTEGGSVASVMIGGKTFTGRQIRETFGLRSTRFTLKLTETEAVFTVSGYGHQVGMSQYGASVLANNGYSYREILAYYYPNTTVEDYFFDE